MCIRDSYGAAKISITKILPIFLFIGGRGIKTKGGYNGGGDSSGGGATDFRVSPALFNKRFLIAGGGGSESFSSYRGLGNGGGINSDKDDGSRGANQTYGFEFGVGQYGGGGGLYGGNRTFGGSGFVYSDDRLWRLFFVAYLRIL